MTISFPFVVLGFSECPPSKMMKRMICFSRCNAWAKFLLDLASMMASLDMVYWNDSSKCNVWDHSLLKFHLSWHFSRNGNGCSSL